MAKLKKKTYCIMCGKNRRGIPVREDKVIGSIRWLKRKLRNEKGNALVVCRDCYDKYSMQRKRFESRQFLYIAIGIVFMVLMIITSPTVLAFIVGILIVMLLYAFAMLSYIPALDTPAGDGGKKRIQ
jgi:uncharacterized membrane protein